MKRLLLLFSLFFSLSFYGQNNQSEKQQTTEGCYVTINGIVQKGIVKMKKEQFKNMVIGYYINLQNETVSDKAISFSIKIPGVQAEQIKGGKIDERMYQKILRTASRGDKITFFDMKQNLNNSKFNGIICDGVAPLIIEIY
jgi:hypothetical protein